jgi:hypothetical protein
MISNLVKFNDWCNKLCKPFIPALNYLLLTIGIVMMGFLIYGCIVIKFDNATISLILYVAGMMIGLLNGGAYAISNIHKKA